MKLILPFLFLSFLSIFSQAQSLQPGLWKAKSQFKLNGIPLPASEDEDCIKSGQAQDAKATIQKELQKKGCQLTSWVVKGNHLDAALTCKSNEIDAKGKLSGQFTAKSYNLSGEAEGTYQDMIPSQATVSLIGQWIRDCKK